MATSPKFRILPRVNAALADNALEYSERCTLAYLILAAGEKGIAWPTHDHIAKQLGMCKRQSKRIVAKLQERGYLRIVQRGLKRANQYVFPWNADFGVTPTSPLEVTPTSPQTDAGVTPTSLPEVTPMSLPIGKENRKSSEEEEEEQGIVLSVEHTSLSVIHTPEAIETFGRFMKEFLDACKEEELRKRKKHAFGINFNEATPRTELVEEILGMAPSWTAAECAYSIELNLSENPGRPKSYAWFKPTLADIYGKRKGKAPKLPNYSEMSDNVAPFFERNGRSSWPPPNLIIHDETPEERRASFEADRKLRERIKRGQEAHEAEMKLCTEQIERWKRVYEQQPPSIRKRMDTVKAVDEVYGEMLWSGASAKAREPVLRALEDGTHEVFRTAAQRDDARP